MNIKNKEDKEIKDKEIENELRKYYSSFKLIDKKLIDTKKFDKKDFNDKINQFYNYIKENEISSNDKNIKLEKDIKKIIKEIKDKEIENELWKYFSSFKLIDKELVDKRGFDRKDFDDKINQFYNYIKEKENEISSNDKNMKLEKDIQRIITVIRYDLHELDTPILHELDTPIKKDKENEKKIKTTLQNYNKIFVKIYENMINKNTFDKKNFKSKRMEYYNFLNENSVNLYVEIYGLEELLNKIEELLNKIEDIDYKKK